MLHHPLHGTICDFQSTVKKRGHNHSRQPAYEWHPVGVGDTRRSNCLSRGYEVPFREVGVVTGLSHRVGRLHLPLW